MDKFDMILDELNNCYNASVSQFNSHSINKTQYYDKANYAELKAFEKTIEIVKRNRDTDYIYVPEPK